MKCPKCGADSSGAFCAECGAPLKGAKCRDCGAPLAPGANYCTNCGARTAEGSSRGGSKAPWFVAGGALLIFVVVLLWPKLSGQNQANEQKVPISQVQNGELGAAGQAGGEGPLTGTPREQADRLFNRIMSERENGDTTQAKFFLPMAIQAYQMVGNNLDADGRYHLSLLQAFSGDYKAARETAEQVLQAEPNHLLALSAAANAARSQGDKAAAQKYYQRFLSAFDAELKTGKAEYQDHSRILPDLKKEAEAAVSGNR
jgi:tetratricopeptide (TPR) repeat protein